MLARTLARYKRFGQDSFFRGVALVAARWPVAVASRPCGFFGNFFITLYGVQFLDSLGLQPIPWWDKSCLYYDETTAPNVWDMFFCGTAAHHTAPRADSPYLKYYAGPYGISATKHQSPRFAAHALMQRFASPRPAFQAECDEFITDTFEGRPAIGVHVRGTDARGTEGRVSIEIDTVHEEILRSLAIYPDAVIFLATDEQKVIESFRGKYKEKLRFRDCLRSTDDRSIHGHYDAGLAASGFRKAREVLLDALILSRCTYLIRTHSAVTTFSLCWNPDLPYVDLERKYLGHTHQPWLHEVLPEAVAGSANPSPLL